MTMGITAAAKMATRPSILYQAAIPLKDSAVTKTKFDNVNIFPKGINIFSLL
jgi:hypothetical protein